MSTEDHHESSATSVPSDQTYVNASRSRPGTEGPLRELVVLGSRSDFVASNLEVASRLPRDRRSLCEGRMPSDHVPLTDYTVIHETLTGTVKWFNNKAGFGFITVCEEGEYKDKDIFIHYSSIRVSNLQYKYLVQGEYVDFTLVKANSDTHEFQAMNVSGVKGGPIMCETRRTMVQTPGIIPTTVNRRNTMRSENEADIQQQRPTRRNFRDNAPRREPRPIIDRTPRTPRTTGTPHEPSTSMNGDDLLGFTKVTKKRKGASVPSSLQSNNSSSKPSVP